MSISNKEKIFLQEKMFFVCDFFSSQKLESDPLNPTSKQNNNFYILLNSKLNILKRYLI